MPGGADRSSSAPLTVLTCESIAVLSRDGDATCDRSDADVTLTPAQVRRRLVGSGPD